jgi:hypothetical protein
MRVQEAVPLDKISSRSILRGKRHLQPTEEVLSLVESILSDGVREQPVLYHDKVADEYVIVSGYLRVSAINMINQVAAGNRPLDMILDQNESQRDDELDIRGDDPSLLEMIQDADRNSDNLTQELHDDAVAAEKEHESSPTSLITEEEYERGIYQQFIVNYGSDLVQAIVIDDAELPQHGLVAAALVSNMLTASLTPEEIGGGLTYLREKEGASITDLTRLIQRARSYVLYHLLYVSPEAQKIRQAHADRLSVDETYHIVTTLREKQNYPLATALIKQNKGKKVSAADLREMKRQDRENRSASSQSDIADNIGTPNASTSDVAAGRNFFNTSREQAAETRSATIDLSSGSLQKLVPLLTSTGALIPAVNIEMSLDQIAALHKQVTGNPVDTDDIGVTLLQQLIDTICTGDADAE